MPTLDDLARRGASEMPLMREAQRAPEAAARPIEVNARGTADACFRAVVAANVAVRVWFEDDAHNPRGEVAAGGLVPPRGPACARKGELLRLVTSPVDATAQGGIVARAVVWQAP